MAGVIPGTRQQATHRENYTLRRNLRDQAPRGTSATPSGILLMEEHLQPPGGLDAHLFALRRDSENIGKARQEDALAAQFAE